MKFTTAAIFAGLSVFSGIVGAAAKDIAAPGEAAVPDEAAVSGDAGAGEGEAPAKGLDDLIKELKNDSFRVRESATREIWLLGETALPTLEKAATSKDPEQVFRARDLLRKIQLHITPDTDPSVIALVERYLKGGLEDKASILGRLKGKRAWRQMLKLYAGETTAEAREKLRDSLDGIAIRAATERLSQGKTEEAREFLEMAPADSEGLLALAEFHRHRGTLAAELEQARAVDSPKSRLWQLALHRAAGDVEAAREMADAAGESEIAASMAALAGDPLPWLKLVGKPVDDSGIVNAYSLAAAKRWQWRKLRPSDLEPLTEALTARSRIERTAAMGTLFLLGEINTAESFFTKYAPLNAFTHFESLERIPEAFSALGLDPEKPDFRTWVEKRLAGLTDDDIEDQRGPSSHSEELIALANFLERRGQHEEAMAAFGEPMAKLAEKDDNVFIDFLGSMFGGTSTLTAAPALAKRIGIAWAGDDEKRWDELLVAAFGDDEQFFEWWELCGDLAPKETLTERLDGMLALFARGTDPGRLREKWMARLWQAADAAPPGKRDEMVQRISNLCIQAGDVTNSLKAWELLPEPARAEVFWGQHIVHLSAAERWSDAADSILKQITLLAEAGQDPVAELHAYAASALRQAGRLEEAETHESWVGKLFLGSSNLAMRIGNGYAYGTDYQRAGEWWERAAILADPESRDFADVLKLHSDILIEKGIWKPAAAISEVIASIYAGVNLTGTSPLLLMRQRLHADMARALANLDTDREAAIQLLAKCHNDFASDGGLADYFFPALRQAGLMEEHDQWFEKTWKFMENTISRYPASDNTRNTAAWFASRSAMRLDEATDHVGKALASSPYQPAYLDTMAEIQFARGNREKALEWSAIAVNYAPADSQLRRQQARFRSDPLPK